MDSRLRRSPPDRASAVPYGQAGENAMRFPRLAHRSAAAHKLHSTPQQDRMNLISGSGETSSRIPIFSLFLPGSCPNNRDRRIEGLQQQCAKQSLGGNRWSAEFGVQLLECRRQSPQRLIHNPPDRPQRMVLWNSRLAVHIAKQRFALHIPTAHRTSPTSRHAAVVVPHIRPKMSTFSVSC